MTNKCRKCSLDIVAAKDGFKCCECSVHYHINCSSETSKKYGTRNKSSWRCNTCIDENSSAASEDRETGQSAVLQALASFREEMKVRLDKMYEDLHAVTTDIGLLKGEIALTAEESKKTKETVGRLQEENTRLNSVVRQLRTEIDDLQQHTRKNNLIISGVPYTKGENIFAILDKIARLINVEFNWYDVSAAHRLPPNKLKKSAIVVNFVSRKTKTIWLQTRKGKKLSAKDLYSSSADETIYFNEHLTLNNQIIYKRGRDLVKKGRIAFAWVNDGRVLVKKTKTGRTFWVRSLEEMENLDTGTSTQDNKDTHPSTASDPALASPPPTTQMPMPPSQITLVSPGTNSS